MLLQTHVWIHRVLLLSQNRDPSSQALLTSPRAELIEACPALTLNEAIPPTSHLSSQHLDITSSSLAAQFLGLHLLFLLIRLENNKDQKSKRLPEKIVTYSTFCNKSAKSVLLRPFSSSSSILSPPPSLLHSSSLLCPSSTSVPPSPVLLPHSSFLLLHPSSSILPPPPFLLHPHSGQECPSSEHNPIPHPPYAIWDEVVKIVSELKPGKKGGVEERWFQYLGLFLINLF